MGSEGQARTEAVINPIAATSALEDLDAERAAARETAGLELRDRGFVRAADRESWAGTLPAPTPSGEVSLEVRLPLAFPDVLPEIRVDPEKLPRRIAHVEKNGKICIAPTSGVLLDADRPRELVRQALARASRELERGITGESDPELQAEFLSYWEPTGADAAYCICSANGPLRTLARMSVRGVGFLKSEKVLIAEDEASAAAWAANVGATASPSGTALFVPLSTAFTPPVFGQPLTVKNIRQLIKAHADQPIANACEHYLASAPLPATVVLSLPEGAAGAGRQLVAVRFDPPHGELAKAAQSGFRPGHVPTWRALQLSGGAPVGRPHLERLDAAYLRARGGAAEALKESLVAIVGVGAIGSEIAQTLADLGVGRLRLIDPDTLRPENVHRHVLGVRHLQMNKAVALATELTSRLPHQSVEARAERVESVLANDGEFVISADLVMIALGDETLERRLNRLLPRAVTRLHSWVEPLGLGGHALLVAPGGPGCFECLLSVDPEIGLFNRAALAAPGQDLRRSLSGCVGTFSPFSVLDAKRTALEAVDLAARFLTGTTTESELTTWRGERTDFEGAGYKLSRRATMVAEGARVRTSGTSFIRSGCPICDRASTAAMVPPPEDR